MRDTERLFGTVGNKYDATEPLSKVMRLEYGIYDLLSRVRNTNLDSNVLSENSSDQSHCSAM